VYDYSTMQNSTAAKANIELSATETEDSRIPTAKVHVGDANICSRERTYCILREAVETKQKEENAVFRDRPQPSDHTYMYAETMALISAVLYAQQCDHSWLQNVNKEDYRNLKRLTDEHAQVFLQAPLQVDKNGNVPKTIFGRVLIEEVKQDFEINCQAMALRPTSFCIGHVYAPDRSSLCAQ
jgi:hypothetical protein